MGLMTLLTGGGEKYTRFDDPYKYDKDDCISCKVLGRFDGVQTTIYVLMSSRVDCVCVSGRLHVFLGHETIEGEAEADRDEQIEIQIWFATVGHCHFVGHICRAWYLQDAQLMYDGTVDVGLSSDS